MLTRIGGSIAEVQIKLGHLLESRVTRLYIKDAT